MNKDVDMTVWADRPQGEWIKRSSVGNWECSVCGSDVIAIEQKYNFCPHCGAKMKGVSDV